MKNLLKIIYSFIPYKFWAYSLLKTVWTPPQSIYKHLHFKGIITVHVDKINKFKMKHYGFQIENEIFWKGIKIGWEKESVKLWVQLCRNVDVVFDIGANTGVYSLIAKTVNHKAQVYAFEPVKRVFDKLHENIQLNNFDVIAVNKAVSNQTGAAVIYDMPTEHIYSVTVNKNLSSEGTEVIKTNITTITLNNFIEQNNIKTVDLMKIDVETHEPEVLEGFSKYLMHHKPTMLIEILNSEVAKRVDACLSGLGYLYFNIEDSGKPKMVQKIASSDFYNFLVCRREVAMSLNLI